MEILILGAGGMAGHLMSIYLQEKGHNVVGFSRKPLDYCENIIGDALQKDVIKEAVTYKKFDVVINCLGVLNKNVDNNISEGIFINSYLPHYIVDCLSKTDTKFIHLSTDCVFSGKDGEYNEDSFKDSDTLYGRTKSLGEINDLKNLTIRTSIIGPDMKEEGVGLLNWFLKQNGPVKGFNSVIWTGVSTITLAQAIEAAIEQNITGLYNLVNNQKISKYELLNLFNNYIKREKIEIIKDDTIHCNKSLINNRKDFNFVVPSYEEMLLDTSRWIVDHKELYKHYF
ncbi:sugar nucleotide-binding protein [Clostridium isatidis]|uniref:dTDP-4-dehydrorhamnose reductase n=1 Tax=Clostridium isatidis TaxID=182773 RepID=A0A343JC54_9CLOT|nr:sugar nucleotide-binding protein [Clostridium isatidis]ASW43112.1 NAD(P)-dependent oxidoreductase [Clostridium isatidis]